MCVCLFFFFLSEKPARRLGGSFSANTRCQPGSGVISVNGGIRSHAAAELGRAQRPHLPEQSLFPLHPEGTPGGRWPGSRHALGPAAQAWSEPGTGQGTGKLARVSERQAGTEPPPGPLLCRARMCPPNARPTSTQDLTPKGRLVSGPLHRRRLSRAQTRRELETPLRSLGSPPRPDL